LQTPDKRWKFNEQDLEERKLWRKYEKAIEEMLPATSTKESPWYIIPADDKWYARAAVADIISSNLTSMDLRYPVVEKAREARFGELIKQLENE
jgi:polyphosphate kinase 2 (PPK2 family)